jgi:hypothetical protein
MRPLLISQQKTPVIKEKTESTLARLGRFTAEGDAVMDEDESKRKMILFECVLSIRGEPLPTLIP